jgi:hypothetical protein
MLSRPYFSLRMIRETIKYFVSVLFVLVTIFLLLMFFGVIWRSPSYYTLSKNYFFSVPIMGMEDYLAMPEHRRPYIYQLKKGNGAVCIIGAEHKPLDKEAQLDSIRYYWKNFQPTIAMVEGRLGFLFSWFQNATDKYGEGGELASLAKKNGIRLYTWEPSRKDEVNMMLEKFSPVHVAMYYSLRPYFSNMRFGKPEHPDKVMQEYIDSRTDIDGIRGVLKSVQQLDNIWEKEFPQLKNWRDISDEQGWPEGILSEMFNYGNILRDQHMCSAIAELIDRGERIILTAGSGHAVRIENTLKSVIQRR